MNCNCWRCADYGHHKHQFDIPLDDGWTETPHRKPSKKKTRHYKGCPENDGNAHVYVWVSLEYAYGWSWDSGIEVKVCAGCGRKTKIRRKAN